MATESTPPPPPSEAELHLTPPPSSLSTSAEQEPQQELTITNNPPIHTLDTHKQQQQKPNSINSVTELFNLSTALSTFHRRYNELHEHIDFIRNSIDSRLALPEVAVQGPSPVHQLEIVPVPKTLANSDQKEEEDNGNNGASSESELESLCATMSSKGLRKYIISRLFDAAKLREEAPAALKRAANPARLVFECMGRFFLQGKRAYFKDSPMIQSRQASVLILEYFLLMGTDGVEIEREVEKEAEAGAAAWLKRLLSEGSLSEADEVDARGLLLYVGCFGIPRSFRNENIMGLIRASNAREIADALRGSRFLVARIPEVIEVMVKNKLELEAVETVFIFGVEDRSPPQAILNSFLQHSKEAWKRTKKSATSSYEEVREAHKKHLSDLKSVKKCLENHKLDHSKLLPEWKINEKTYILEREIADLKKKIGDRVVSKRKADQTESSRKFRTQEVKRPRFVSHADTNNSYENLAPKNSLDGGLHGHIYTYSTSPSRLPYLPENAIGSVPGSGVGAAMLARTGPTGAIDGVHERVVLVDRLGQVISHDARAYEERLMGQVISRDGRAYEERLMGQVISRDGRAYEERLMGQVLSHDGRAYEERLTGHNFAGHPDSIVVNGGLYRPSSQSGEGSFGLGNPSSIGVANRSSGSDLYRFADSVLERDSYYGSGSRTAGAVLPQGVPAHGYASGSREVAATVARAVPGHHSSYLC